MRVSSMSSSDGAPDRDHRVLPYLLWLLVAAAGSEGVAEAAEEELLEEVAFHVNETAGPCPYLRGRSVMDLWPKWKF